MVGGQLRPDHLFECSQRLRENGRGKAEGREQAARAAVANAVRQGQPQPCGELVAIHGATAGSARIDHAIADLHAVGDLQDERVGQLLERPEHHQQPIALVGQLDGLGFAFGGAVQHALAVLEDGQYVAAFHTIGRAAVDHHDLVLRGIRDGGAIGGHNGALHPDLGRAGHVAHQLARRLGEPVEGTTVTLLRRGRAGERAAIAEAVRDSLWRWCRYCRLELSFEDLASWEAAEPTTGRACPMCERTMVSITVGTDADEVDEGHAGDGPDSGEVPVDVCVVDQVIWFDVAELELLPEDLPDPQPTAEQEAAVADIARQFGDELVAADAARVGFTTRLLRRLHLSPAAAGAVNPTVRADA